jgi:hypothetical protein
MVGESQAETENKLPTYFGENMTEQEKIENVCNGIAESYLEASDQEIQEIIKEEGDDTEATRDILLRGFQGKHIEEIKEVKELGERIGYGNILDICSILWAMRLGTIPRIVVTPNPDKQECATAEYLIKKRIKDYKAFGV